MAKVDYTREYYTKIPNMIDDLGLSPIAIAMYLQYARWAAATRKRPPGVKEMMQKFRCSDRTIRDAKQELVSKGLITIFSRRSKGLPDAVSLRDIWERNYKHCEALKSEPVVNERQVSKPSFMNDSPFVDERLESQNLSLQSDSRKENLREIKNETWISLAERLRENLPANTYSTWFTAITCGSEAANPLELHANEMTIEWVSKHYQGLMIDLGMDLGVEQIEWRIRNG